MSILDTARMGKFSSDRSIREYRGNTLNAELFKKRKIISRRGAEIAENNEKTAWIMQPEIEAVDLQ